MSFPSVIAERIAETSRSSSLSRLVTYFALSAIGLIAVAPMVQPVHLLPLPSFYSQWLAIALGLAAGVVFVTPQFWRELAIPTVSLFFLALVALIALQSLLVQHIYVAQALLPALYLAWAALLTSVAFRLRTQIGTDKVVRVFAWFALVGGILHTLIGLSQYVEYAGLFDEVVLAKPGETIVGNFVQPNHYATHLALATAALIYLYAVRDISTVLANVLLILFTCVLALSGSRSVFIYAGVMLLVSSLCFWKIRDETYRRLTVASGYFLALFILAQFLLPPVSELVQRALVEWGFLSSTHKIVTAAGKLGSGLAGMDIRLSEWHKAWLMFQQSPVWGVGIGHYGWFSFNYQAQPEFSVLTKEVLYTHSHNVFAQIGAELGGVGLVLLLGLLYGWIKQFLRNWQTSASWFIGVCLLVLFVHSNLEYPLWYSYFLGIAAFLFGLGDHRKIRPKFTPWLGQAAATIVLVLSGFILAITFFGYRSIQTINNLVLQSSPERAARTLQAVSRNVLLTPWAEETMVTHGIPNKKLIDKQLEVATRVFNYHPNPLKAHGQITYLAFAGKIDDSIHLLNVAALAYPTHLPWFVCTWQRMTEKEVRPVAEHARQLLGTPPTCDD